MLVNCQPRFYLSLLRYSFIRSFYERGSQAKNLPGPARQLKLLTASLLPIKPENCGCEPGSAATRSATTHCFSLQIGNISRRSCGNCGNSERVVCGEFSKRGGNGGKPAFWVFRRSHGAAVSTASVGAPHT